eukprot:scaffold149808_cov28-Attheya_sp.AAC.1
MILRAGRKGIILFLWIVIHKLLAITSLFAHGWSVRRSHHHPAGTTTITCPRSGGTGRWHCCSDPNTRSLNGILGEGRLTDDNKNRSRMATNTNNLLGTNEPYEETLAERDLRHIFDALPFQTAEYAVNSTLLPAQPTGDSTTTVPPLRRVLPSVVGI